MAAKFQWSVAPGLVTSVAGTDELMSYYPPAVKAWIARKGGLTAQMKRVLNGSQLWAIIDPCPEEHPAK